MKVEVDYPPNYEAICAVFPEVRRMKGVVFTYGPIIFNPSGQEITPDLMHHEQTHTIQQGSDPALWWENYLKDGEFRLAQELEAYQVQYNFARQNWHRTHRKNLLFRIAKDLSGPMYGKMISKQEALKLIKGEK